MTEACGVDYAMAKTGIEFETVDGVEIPFAGPELMLKMKQSSREKDALDRDFLQRLIRDKNK